MTKPSGAFLEVPQNRRLLAQEIRAQALREKQEKESPYLQKDPLSLVTAGKLQIKTKDGQRVPLRLNACQRKVFAVIRTLRQDRKPIRIWILKFRQGGISTLIEAILYSLTSVQPNRNALVMADEDPKSAYIHEMSKHYHDHMLKTDPAITPQKKRSNAKVLEFESIQSQMMIVTAKNYDAPRARTYQYVHLSEFAFYEYFALVMQALQGVPSHDDSMIIGETTANGEGTDAHKAWEAAKLSGSDWIPIFLPWYIMEEYERPAPDYPIEQIIYDRQGGSLEAFQEEEDSLRVRIRDYLAAEGLTHDELTISKKLNWRRWKIVNDCQRLVSTFRVEYPATDEEAWAASGQRYYPEQFFEKQVALAPKRRGYLVPGPGGPEIRDSVDGPISFFKFAERGDSFVIASDPSDGIDGDEAAAVVRHVRSNSNYAELASRSLDADHLAAQVHLLEQLYPGIHVPEVNSMGAALLSSLRRITGRIWHGNVTAKGVEPTHRDGWYTDNVSRPLAFEQLGFDLRDAAVKLNGEQSIRECKRLINNAGKPEAPSNEQDGLAICNAIASKARALRPPKPYEPTGSPVRSGPARKPPPNMGTGFRRGK